LLPSNFSGLGPVDPPADGPASGALEPAQNPSPSPSARNVLTIIATLLVIWGCGWLIRNLARSDEVARLASMILFAPVPVVSIWFGWRTRWRIADCLAAAFSLLLGFIVWNGIMLQGLGNPSQLREVISLNALHWVLFVLAGATTARWIQWVSRIGIWSMAVSDEEPETKALSVIRLMGITAAVAALAVSYRVIFNASIEEAKPWVDMGFPNGATHWYSWFPLRSKIWVSGAIGGLLIGVHWFAIVGILRSGSYRMAGLVLWIVVAAGLRWSANQIYWGEIPILGDGPILIDLGFQSLSGSLAFLPVQIAIQTLVEGTLQTLITCASIYWLRGLGYRIGLSDWAKGQGPPALAFPSGMQ
jgi:hypothetical protein